MTIDLAGHLGSQPDEHRRDQQTEDASDSGTRRRLGGTPYTPLLQAADTSAPGEPSSLVGTARPATTATRSKRRRRRRHHRPWYRRPLVAVPLVLLLIVAGFGSFAVYRLNETLATIHSLNTPPPSLALNPNDGDNTNPIAVNVSASGSDVTVSTGPARAAVAAANNSGSDHGGLFGKVKLVARNVSAIASGAGAAAGIAAAPPPPPSMNILLMGVDTRPGQPIDIGVRPDFLEVLHLDPATGSCRLLAIPRDSRVELPGYGMTKINHAMMLGGIPYEREVVQQFLGITIDHYGLIDFNGLQELVNTVGGVTVDNPYAFTHEGVSFPAGRITLNGAKALNYARYRYGPDGDFGRVKKQQQVIRAVMDKVAHDNPVTAVPNYMGILGDNTRTDLSTADMISLALKFRSSCTSSTMWMGNIPGVITQYQDPIFKKKLWYVVEQPSAVKQMVQELTQES